MKYSFAIACALLAVLLVPALADVPEFLSYQGVLTDASGSAVPDGTYNVAFRLYTAEVGGSPVWQEAHLVTVTKGIFNATLGWTQPLGILDFDLPYYLGISVEGGAELAPRTLLTNAAYAMNARMVKGSLATSNKIPATGDVGVGTTNPQYPLHIVSAAGQVGLQLDGNDASWTSLYVNAVTGANAGIGLMRGGTLRAYMGVNSANGLFLGVNGPVPGIAISSAGNVAIGNITPFEKLHVDGGLRIGTTAIDAPGTMRWTGTDFEGYDGSVWKSLTATGGGSLPPGSAGQTLRHNGSDWIATSNLYNSGTSLGVGTTSPTSKLHLEGGAAQEEIFVNQTSSTGSALVRLKTNGGLYDHFALQKFASSTGGSIDGISLNNLSLLDAGINGSAMMLRVASGNPMYFMTTNLERMRLTAGGNLGINTKTPEAKLHVDGNMWDVANTEGDFKIGDASYRLKFGVATGGGGAGTARMFVAGGAEKLILGAGTSEVLSLNGAGVDIGSSSANGDLELYRSGVATKVLRAYTNAHGGNIDLFDEENGYVAIMEADYNGTGGYLSVYRSAGYQGFTVDGNGLGVGEPIVSITGSSRSAVFDMDQSGNATVALPQDAISSTEIQNEPGTATYTEGSATITLGVSLSTIGSQTITVPAAGYVLVIANAQFEIFHTNGTSTDAIVGVSNTAAFLPGNQDIRLALAAGLPSSLYAFPVSAHAVFSVAGAGAYTYYFLGREDSGEVRLYDIQLTCLYIPTAYGTVEAPAASAAASIDANAPVRPAIDIEAQRAASEAANMDRIERELAAMRAELEAVKTKLGNEQR